MAGVEDAASSQMLHGAPALPEILFVYVKDPFIQPAVYTVVERRISQVCLPYLPLLPDSRLLCLN